MKHGSNWSEGAVAAITLKVSRSVENKTITWPSKSYEIECDHDEWISLNQYDRKYIGTIGWNVDRKQIVIEGIVIAL